MGGALLAGVPSLSHAQAPVRPQARSLGDLFNLRTDRRDQAPPAGRYVAENVGFTFDRSSSAVRFDGGREIIVLMRQSAPNGGVIYFNDVGEPVLKVSGLGGMTLFTPEQPQGIPVSFVAVAAPIRMEVLIRPGLDMSDWVQSMSRDISRAVGPGARIGIEAPLPLDQDAYPLLADVLLLTQQAVVRNARRERAREKMRALSTIFVQMGSAPAVKVERDVLRITIAPSRGIAGRPSSEKIARALR